MLVRATAHTNDYVRMNSICALGQIHADPESVVPALIKCLRDPFPDVRANAAADIAHQAALSLAQWSPCTSPPATAAACEQQLIDQVGPQVYRHPLAAAERQELQTLFDAGVQEKDFATGVEWFLSGVLESPDFLYQLPKLQAGEQPGQLVAIPPYELASRLSYFIWDSMPDDALYAAASTSELADAARLGSQLDRMLKDPRFLRGVTGFYRSWLNLGGFREVARDDAAFTTDVVSALQTSLLMSATQLYQGSTPANVAGLFTGSTYYLNGALRSFYGLPGSDAAFTAADMASDERRGILAHPGLMALLARPDQSNPISRGLYLRRVIMCQDLPPPPAGIDIPPLPPVAPGLSTRDRLDQHTKAPLCASCHDMIDPPGFALENFDQVGRHRTQDSGKATDMPATDVAPINSILPRLKIIPARKQYTHWRFPACCKSSTKLNPSYPRSPRVNAKSTAANRRPNAKSK